ncbi:MAG: hypothetical protein GF409_04350 [Candidatus Omnitrophica bacterium]|nr:hypothetical protein [Candidatus Omnitrophota bacterium]
MIERDPRYYVTGYDGRDPYKAPFYINALSFDGEEGGFNCSLIEKFNEFIRGHRISSSCRLEGSFKKDSVKVPSRIVVVNASHDDLPTSYETARIFNDFCREKGYAAEAVVVNTREHLLKEVNVDPEETLLVSQCVDKNVYNVALAEELAQKGTVTVPGRVTAPGSVFSDKDSTYRLLSEEGSDWSKVARYVKVPVEGKSVEEVVDELFQAVDELEQLTGDITFFVKPHEGGGGLGGFRITKVKEGYIIPDLSKVSGDLSEIHPTFIDFDLSSEAKLRELLWIYRLFAGNDKMSENYLKVKLPVMNKDQTEAIGILKEYLAGSEIKRHKKLAGMVLSPEKARSTLVEAIKIFEKKFYRRYVPLVNEHIDFGLWGLRAHYRLSTEGPRLETMYHRIFQLGFTEEGLGYVGSDNISNKQTGDLEITRLGPVNPIMLEAIGGEQALFDSLLKGAEALAELNDLLADEEKGSVPLRLQLDLATISRRIGEGNADTARGLCLASRWSDFVRNARQWLEDSLVYYTKVKESG